MLQERCRGEVEAHVRWHSKNIDKLLHSLYATEPSEDPKVTTAESPEPTILEVSNGHYPELKGGINGYPSFRMPLIPYSLSGRIKYMKPFFPVLMQNVDVASAGKNDDQQPMSPAEIAEARRYIAHDRAKRREKRSPEEQEDQEDINDRVSHADELLGEIAKKHRIAKEELRRTFRKARKDTGASSDLESLQYDKNKFQRFVDKILGRYHE